MNYSGISIQHRKKAITKVIAFFGSPRRARTIDIVINSHALYRLSYWGINAEIYGMVHHHGLEPWTH